MQPLIATSLAPETNKSSQVGDKTVYKHYLKSMGWFVAALSLFFATLFGFFLSFPSSLAHVLD
jgi:hypothetical protein